MGDLCRHAAVSNAPVMRPLWYDFPAVADSFALEDQFMFGPAIMVAPVLEAGAVNREVIPGIQLFEIIMIHPEDVYGIHISNRPVSVSPGCGVSHS